MAKITPKQKIFVTLLAVFILGTAGALTWLQMNGYFSKKLNAPLSALPNAVVTIENFNGDSFEFRTKVAQTPEAQAQGLMHLKAMPENEGMLFLFEKPAVRRFWMKDTQIPLDIIFVSQWGDIVYIEHARQPFDQEPFGPDAYIDTVLEINAGLAEALNIEVGDQLTYEMEEN